MKVCSTDCLYHYMLRGDNSLKLVLKNGLLPLSCFPESDEWKRLEEALPGFYKTIYETFAQPVIQKPYSNSGVFLTPIDFRLMPGSLLTRHARVVVPLEAVDPAHAALTYVLDEERVSLPLNTGNLEQAAAIWTDAMVGEWFAKKPNMIFFFVPQVAVYQEGGIPVDPAWFQPAVKDNA